MGNKEKINLKPKRRALETVVAAAVVIFLSACGSESLNEGASEEISGIGDGSLYDRNHDYYKRPTPFCHSYGDRQCPPSIVSEDD